MNPEKEKLSVTYRDIEITYDERHNKWRFNLRGKDRSAETLTNAKGAIDAPAPKDDKPFRRFEAWQRSYNGLHKVTVTSLTEGGRYWITGQDDRGRKERAQAGTYELYPCNPENDAVIERIRAKTTEIDALRKELEVIQKELRNVEPKDWEVNETA